MTYPSNRSKYQQRLIREGFAETRIKLVEEAMDAMIKALCYMDGRNIKLFWKKSFPQRLRDYAADSMSYDPTPKRKKKDEKLPDKGR